MLYGFSPVIEYHFGHSTCNCGLFLLKISSEDAYLQGESDGGQNWSKLVQFGLVWGGSFILR